MTRRVLSPSGLPTNITVDECAIDDFIELMGWTLEEFNERTVQEFSVTEDGEEILKELGHGVAE